MSLCKLQRKNTLSSVDQKLVCLNCTPHLLRTQKPLEKHERSCTTSRHRIANGGTYFKLPLQVLQTHPASSSSHTLKLCWFDVTHQWCNRRLGRFKTLENRLTDSKSRKGTQHLAGVRKWAHYIKYSKCLTHTTVLSFYYRCGFFTAARNF